MDMARRIMLAIMAAPSIRHATTNRSRLLVVFASIITLLVALFLHFVPVSKPYASIEAVSDLVSFRVIRPLAASIPVRQARLNANLDQCPAATSSPPPFLFTGVIEPARNAIIHYRISGDRISIQVEGESKGGGREHAIAILRSSNQPDCYVLNRLSVVLERQGTKVIGLDQPLPISGPAEIGKEFGAPVMPNEQRATVSGTMWGGTVRVFGRTFLSGKLYPAADAEFPLPAGGRLSLGDTLGLAPPKNEADSMYGIARVGDESFAISATTVSSDLKLYRPGTVRGEAETFSLGLLTSLFSDPSVAWIVVIIAIFTAVTQTLGSWISLWGDPEEQSRKGATAKEERK